MKKISSHIILRCLIFCLLVCLFSSVSSFASSDPNLVAWWKFDGDFLDSSGNGHHGTFYDDNGSGAQWISGIDGQGINLDGVDDYVVLESSDVLDEANSFTISFWVLSHQLSFDSDRGIIGFGDDSRRSPWIWGEQGSDTLRAVFYKDVGIIDGNLECEDHPLPYVQWRHVAVTWDNTNNVCYLYVEGEVKASCDTTGTSLVSSNGIKYLGHIEGYGYWDGYIDDVRIYDRALGGTEIADIMGPIVAVSPVYITFNAYEAGGNPSPKAFTVSNPGGGTLNWSIDTTSKPSWLTINPLSGALNHEQSEPVTVSINISDLPGGHYSYNFLVTDPNVVHSAGHVQIVLDVVGPALSVSESTFIFSSMESGENPPDQILTIQNTGGGTLNWSIDPTSKPSWLTINPLSGALNRDQTEIVTLSVDITSLSGGQYSYSFEVSDPSAEDSPRTITAKLWLGTIKYVDDDAPNDPGPYDPNVSDPLEDGSEEHPFDAIQEAIDTASNADVFVLKVGTYTSDGNRDIIFPDKAITIRSIDPYDPNIVANTVIDCQGSETSQHYGVRLSDSDSIVDGITITNAYFTSTDPPYYGSGGAINIGFGNHQIIRCRLTNNTALEGGGIFCSNYMCGTIIIDSCVIQDNTATSEYYFGGGGGIYVDWKTYVVITNCIISGNKALSSGGGVFLDDSYNTYYWLTGNDAVTNCTITGNSTAADGGGIYVIGYQYNMKNNIIWNNRADSAEDLYCECNYPLCWIYLDVDYSIIDPSKTYHITFGEGSINEVPDFANPGYWDNSGTPDDESDDLWIGGDYHLKSQAGRWDPNNMEWVYDDVTSPCVDTGNPADNWTNELWPHGGCINMGAYGGTPQASMSPNPVGNIADLNHDNIVDVLDLMLECEDWLYEKYLLDTDLTRNGRVDISDIADFSSQWLWSTP